MKPMISEFDILQTIELQNQFDLSWEVELLHKGRHFHLQYTISIHQVKVESCKVGTQKVSVMTCARGQSREPVRPVTGRDTQLPSEILHVHEFISHTKPAHLISPCQYFPPDKKSYVVSEPRARTVCRPTSSRWWLCETQVVLYYN